MSRVNEGRSHVGLHNGGGDQQSIFAFTFACVADEVGKTGFVCTQAFAGHVVAHQGTVPVTREDHKVSGVISQRSAHSPGQVLLQSHPTLGFGHRGLQTKDEDTTPPASTGPSSVT